MIRRRNIIGKNKICNFVMDIHTMSYFAYYLMSNTMTANCDATLYFEYIGGHYSPTMSPAATLRFNGGDSGPTVLSGLDGAYQPYNNNPTVNVSKGSTLSLNAGAGQLNGYSYNIRLNNSNGQIIDTFNFTGSS